MGFHLPIIVLVNSHSLISYADQIIIYIHTVTRAFMMALSADTGIRLQAYFSSKKLEYIHSSAMFDKSNY